MFLLFTSLFLLFFLGLLFERRDEAVASEPAITHDFLIGVHRQLVSHLSALA